MLMLIFICILCIISIRDMKDQIIPDGILLIAIGIRILGYVFIEGFQWKGLLMLLADGLAISLPLLVLVVSVEKILKKETIGGGDIKLLFVTGLYLGWEKNLLTIFLACIIGLVWSVMRMKKDLPFGPAIAAGAMISMVIGNQMLGIYV